MTRVEADGAWEDEVALAVARLFTEQLGPAIAADAARYCPEKTGALAASIEHHLEGPDLVISATGGADGRTYAAYVELGTGPHVIRPNGKQALHWEGAAHPVREVHHPGSRPQPFLRPALLQQRGE
ncbi:HK97 gp10 family phage protein [Kitasatospora sp. NPDC001683]